MSFFETLSNVKLKAYEGFMKTHNALSSSSIESNFAEGMLTPEEFVQAGDALVHKCPTWKWSHGKHQVDYLPPNKQFLITENVPCFSRVRDECPISLEKITVDGEEWVGMFEDKSVEPEEIPDVLCPALSSSIQNDEEDQNIPDFEDFDPEDNSIVDEDQATFKDTEETILKTRTYDINIHYDKYYRTPRVWLFGYDENRNPLQPHEIFADVSSEYAKKTVTFDTHPHLGIQQAYIHPCKHALVMKKIMEILAQSGKEFRVDLYMPLFLKFISSVIPHIEYDYTF